VAEIDAAGAKRKPARGVRGDAATGKRSAGEEPPLGLSLKNLEGFKCPVDVVGCNIGQRIANRGNSRNKNAIMTACACKYIALR
jgi:hypothetical protein